MIQCKICNREFKSQITNSHLKTHDTNTSEYRLQFGDDSLSSVEYRAAKSRSMTGTNNPSFGQRRQWTAEQKEKLKGRIPHNKGVQMSDSQKTKLRDDALSRNHHWRQTDTHPLKGHSVSDETKLKIRKVIEEMKSQGLLITKSSISKFSGIHRGTISKHLNSDLNDIEALIIEINDSIQS